MTLKPDETEEYVSEYLLLATTPSDVKSLTVTYRFPGTADVRAREPVGWFR